MSTTFPSGLIPRGDSIHVSRSDLRPHLTGDLDGDRVHIPWYGQTTIPMFTEGGHRLGEVQSLCEKFPTIFRDSGLGS